MKSDAITVEAYLGDLPEDRREAIDIVRKVILDTLPDGYDETIRWGMITYEVPLTTCPDTYNGQPLQYAALASQKRHMAVYLTGLYIDAELEKRFVSRWKERGTRLDMGKSCIRFRKLEDLEMDLVGEVIQTFPVQAFIEKMEQSRGAGS